MKKGNFVSLKKTESVTEQSGALVDGYNLKGYLINDICVGEKIEVIRTERNGEEVTGWFESSNIESISGNVIKTNNSCWEIENILSEEK